jgi:phosphate propanoyltransferase
MDRATLKELIKQLIMEQMEEEKLLIPIGVSNRHIHITQADFEQLFPGEELEVFKWLEQTGEFAAKQRVTMVGSKGEIKGVRILGPFREATQIEISKTDGRVLGINPPIRMSGEVENSPGVILESPKGRITLDQGVIVAKRHIHMPTSLAQTYQVAHGESVSVELLSKERGLIFHEVVVRVAESFSLELHIDTDEANGGGVIEGTMARIVR